MHSPARSHRYRKRVVPIPGVAHSMVCPLMPQIRKQVEAPWTIRPGEAIVPTSTSKRESHLGSRLMDARRSRLPEVFLPYGRACVHSLLRCDSGPKPGSVNQHLHGVRGRINTQKALRSKSSRRQLSLKLERVASIHPAGVQCPCSPAPESSKSGQLGRESHHMGWQNNIGVG